MPTHVSVFFTYTKHTDKCMRVRVILCINIYFNVIARRIHTYLSSHTHTHTNIGGKVVVCELLLNTFLTFYKRYLEGNASAHEFLNGHWNSFHILIIYIYKYI